MRNFFSQGDACDITIHAQAFEGGFLRNDISLYRVMSLAALGQNVLATPEGLADLWQVDARLIGKIVPALMPAVTCSGGGYVRELSVSEYVATCSRLNGSTPDLSLILSMGWKVPTGAISKWRGRGLPQSKRAQVFQRDGEICTYCKSAKRPFHIDHVVPVASGGGDELENLVVACAGCNMAKSSMTVEAFKLKAGLV